MRYSSVIALLISGILSVSVSCAGVCSKGSIAVFGGTGKLGSECVFQALKEGNKVSVLAKDRNRMTIPPGSGGSLAGNKLEDSLLTVYEGSVTDEDAVNNVFEGNDISGVIIALGGRSKNVGTSMLTDGTKNIINSMNRFGVRRVAVVTSIGCGDSERKAPLFFRALMYTVMRKTMKDKNNQEGLFLRPDGPGHELEYVIARPGGLGVGPPTGVVNANLEANGAGGEGGSIHRADLAKFLLRAVDNTVTDFPYLRKTPGISSFKGTGWKKEKSADFDAPTEV